MKLSGGWKGMCRKKPTWSWYVKKIWHRRVKPPDCCPNSSLSARSAWDDSRESRWSLGAGCSALHLCRTGSSLERTHTSARGEPKEIKQWKKTSFFYLKNVSSTFLSSSKLMHDDRVCILKLLNKRDLHWYHRTPLRCVRTSCGVPATGAHC